MNALSLYQKGLSKQTAYSTPYVGSQKCVFTQKAVLKVRFEVGHFCSIVVSAASPLFSGTVGHVGIVDGLYWWFIGRIIRT